MTEQSTIVAKEAMTEPAAARVLILCDHIEQTQVLCRTLESQGYEAIGVSASDALTQLHPGRFDLMITDLNAPQIDVLNLLSAARRIDPELVCVSTTGNAGSDFGIRARQLGVDVLPKSFDPEVMPLLAHRSLEMRRLRRENAELLRRQSELQLELELANREIESFSAAVSHDLRAPLRRISGFGSLLKDEYGPTLRPDARRLLDHIVGGTARMDRLIDDLLRYCRSNRAPLRKSRVDCDALVGRVLIPLQAAQKDRELILHIGRLPECEADSGALEQVFVNLLSNAFKFTRGRHPATIEVGSMPRHGETVMFVADNGVGFDTRYATRLFELFQRMHPQHEFEGTGVGLSIARRIVERHGGRIWVESRPQEGTTFYFTLSSPSSSSPGTRVA